MEHELELIKETESNAKVRNVGTIISIIELISSSQKDLEEQEHLLRGVKVHAPVSATHAP